MLHCLDVHSHGIFSIFKIEIIYTLLYPWNIYRCYISRYYYLVSPYSNVKSDVKIASESRNRCHFIAIILQFSTVVSLFYSEITKPSCPHSVKTNPFRIKIWVIAVTVSVRKNHQKIPWPHWPCRKRTPSVRDPCRGHPPKNKSTRAPLFEGGKMMDRLIQGATKTENRK